MVKSRWSSAEHMVHHRQLFYFLFSEHVHTTCLFLSEAFSLHLYSFFEQDFYNELFGLVLQKVVGVILFLFEMIWDLLDIFRTTVHILPKRRLFSIIFLSVLKKMALKLVIVKHQIFLTGPMDGVWGSFNLFNDSLLSKSHIDVLHNGCL